MSHWRTGVNLPSSSISSRPPGASPPPRARRFCGASVSPSQEDSVESGGCELARCAAAQHEERRSRRRASQPLKQPCQYYLLADPRSRTMTGMSPHPQALLPGLSSGTDKSGFLHGLKCSSGDFWEKVKAPLRREEKAGRRSGSPRGTFCSAWGLLCSALSGGCSAAPAELLAQARGLQPQNTRLPQPAWPREMGEMPAEARM